MSRELRPILVGALMGALGVTTMGWLVFMILVVILSLFLFWPEDW